MASTVKTLTLTGTGLQDGSTAIGQQTVTYASPLNPPQQGNFSATTSMTQLTVPTGANALYLQCATGNTNNVSVGGVTGDTGMNVGPLASPEFYFVPVVSGTTTVWLKAASSTTISYKFV